MLGVGGAVSALIAARMLVVATPTGSAGMEVQ